MKNKIFYQKAQELRNSNPKLTHIILSIMEVVFSNDDDLPNNFFISGHHYSLENVYSTINELAPEGTRYQVNQNGDYFFAEIIPQE